MTSTLTPAAVQRSRARGQALPDRPTVDLVVPAYNEAAALEANVRRLHARVRREAAFRCRLVIVDNGSSDDTALIARRLARELPGVHSLRIGEPGRGRALRSAWLASRADIVAYTDADLSTDVEALLPLVDALASGRADIAIGSRLVRGAHVVRGHRRELISRAYNLLLRTALHVRFVDAQCGFKALRRDAAHDLLHDVVDDGWFFDTELLVRAERAGLRIAEIPVTWVDDPHSKVKLLRTAVTNLRGIARLRTDVITAPAGIPEHEATLSA